MSGLRRCPVYRGRIHRKYFTFCQIKLLKVSGLRKCPVYRVSGLRRFYCTYQCKPNSMFTRFFSDLFSFSCCILDNIVHAYISVSNQIFRVSSSGTSVHDFLQKSSLCCFVSILFHKFLIPRDTMLVFQVKC